MSSDLSLTLYEIITVNSWKQNVPAARERIKLNFPWKSSKNCGSDLTFTYKYSPPSRSVVNDWSPH